MSKTTSLLTTWLAIVVSSVAGHPAGQPTDTATLISQKEWYDAMDDWQYWLSLGQNLLCCWP